MADPRTALVAEARRWIGTPYCHQAATHGAGCDCLGLVRGVWRVLRGHEPAPIPPYSPDWAEAEGIEALWQALTLHMRPVTGPMQMGEVLLFRLRPGSMAKHLGILTDTGPNARFVHAYAGHGVVESPLGTPWARRIVARFDMI